MCVCTAVCARLCTYVYVWCMIEGALVCFGGSAGPGESREEPDPPELRSLWVAMGALLLVTFLFLIGVYLIGTQRAGSPMVNREGHVAW